MSNHAICCCIGELCLWGIWCKSFIFVSFQLKEYPSFSVLPEEPKPQRHQHPEICFVMSYFRWCNNAFRLPENQKITGKSSTSEKKESVSTKSFKIALTIILIGVCVAKPNSVFLHPKKSELNRMPVSRGLWIRFMSWKKNLVFPWIS